MSISLKVDVKSDTKNLKKLLKLIDKIDNAVEVGFFDGHIHPTKRDGEFTVAEVAATNEFGPESPVNSDSIPSRPFFRETLKQNKNYVIPLRNKMSAVVRGKVKTKQALKELGMKIQQDVQEMIADNDFVQEAPLTLARKDGQSDPLTETGTMERDVDYRVT